jgi:hypothetical protein
MTCMHRGCTTTATTRCRFGDGTWYHGSVKHRQTFVRYCDRHLDLVAGLFTLCDITREDRPNGPLPHTLPGRHPDLVARLTR